MWNEPSLILNCPPPGTRCVAVCAANRTWLGEARGFRAHALLQQSLTSVSCYLPSKTGVSPSQRTSFPPASHLPHLCMDAHVRPAVFPCFLSPDSCSFHTEKSVLRLPDRPSHPPRPALTPAQALRWKPNSTFTRPGPHTENSYHHRRRGPSPVLLLPRAQA